MKFHKTIHNFPVHPIGIGTWLIGGGVFSDKLPFAVYGNEDKEKEALRFSLKLGQNHIDTAQMYGAGHTEEIIGEVINNSLRKKIYLATKIWRTHATRNAVVKEVERMLIRLQTSYIDLLYMHGPWPEVDMKECIEGMNEAVQKRYVKALGVSNFNLDQLKTAMKFSNNIVAIQNHYSLIDRSFMPKELLFYCQRNNITVVAYKPLERKNLLDGQKYPVLEYMAKKYNKTIGQVCLNWLISQENVVAIPKSIEKSHIRENVEAADFELSTQDMERLNSLV